jgi:hypothetical protein
MVHGDEAGQTLKILFIHINRLNPNVFRGSQPPFDIPQSDSTPSN